MNEGKKVFRIGPIRPPSEADSLLLQVTEGCTWNKCRFCNLYRHTTFRAFTVDSIKADIDVMGYYADIVKRHRIGGENGRWDIDAINREMDFLSHEERHCYYMIANWLICGGKNVFLQDGNTLALSAARLTEVLRYLREVFPHVERVTSYGRAETLAKVSAEEYRILKSVGLDRIHSGFEAGSDEVLALINKGVTAEEQIRAGKNIKEGGIELSVYFMPGVGGRDLSRENALGMARVVREINPDFVRLRTAAVKEGTELYEMYERGEITLCSDDEKVMEIRTLIEETNGCTGRLVSDHIINLLQTVEGNLTSDRETMLRTIDNYLNLPQNERRLFQMARRTGRALSPSDLSRMNANQINDLRRMCEAAGKGRAWDESMNALISQYI